MNQEFIEFATINYYETDHNLKLTLPGLTLHLQDLAINHSNAIGFTLSWLAEQHKGWAITNWHITINRLPKFGEEIQFITWADSCRRMQAQRSFRVLDAAGKTLCQAVSRWIFMDLIHRAPSFITEEMQAAYCCTLPPALENERYRMPKPSESALWHCRLFRVTGRDTDTNGHVNNTKYIEWANDNVPNAISHAYEACDLRVVYRRECYQDSYIASKCYISALDENTFSVVSLFTDPLHPNVIFAEVAVLWRKKPTEL